MIAFAFYVEEILELSAVLMRKHGYEVRRSVQIEQTYIVIMK